METEKQIIRDIWIYLKEHHDPPTTGTEASAAFWEKAAKDISALAGEKWNNHSLAMDLGMEVYSYLEKKSKGGGSA